MVAKPKDNTPTEPIKLPRELGVGGDLNSVWDNPLFCVDGMNVDLQFPYSIKTFQEMRKNIAIASALNAVQIIALRVGRYVEPYDQTPTHAKRAKFVDEALGVSRDNNDMTHSFDDFLREAMSMNIFGFSVHEKVFRPRLNKYGSKHDDGLWGIKRLPIRPQTTIEKFEMDKKNRDVLGVYQKTKNNSGSFTIQSLVTKKNVQGKFIPRNRFLLFKADSENGSPLGLSPLANAYDTWRELQKYKDLENIASSKNLNGLPVLYMPSEHMVDDPNDIEASTAYKAIKDGLTKVGNGQQQGMILPSDREEYSGGGGKLYELDLKSVSSSNITSISNIIQRLTNEIYQCLFADVLQMGNERGGNSNLASAKTSFLTYLVENRIKEIFTVINSDLIPQWFEMNGWDKNKTPQLRYKQLKEVDISTFAKAIQQTKATNSIAITPKNINYIAEQLGLPERLDEGLTSEELKEILGVGDEMQSRSGDGMEKGSGNGTSDNVAARDNSASNLSNK